MEKLIGPTVSFKELEGSPRVIVNAVDDHFHKVNAIRLDVIRSRKALHGNLDKLGQVLVSMAPEVEHDSLGELAPAYAIHCT